MYYALDGLSALDLNRAMAFYRQEVETRDADDLAAQAIRLHIFGRMLLDAGDVPRAVTILERALALQRAQGVGWNPTGGSGMVLCDLGRAAWLQGDLERALGCYQESLQIFKEVDDNESIAIVSIYYGYAALTQGDLARAARSFRTSLELWWGVGEHRYTPMLLAGVANVAELRGNAQQAARLFGAAAQCETMLQARPPSERVGYERLMTAARQHLGDPAFAAAWAVGQTLTLEQAVALALGTEQSR
jgi:tetratricopeptide (TPR) repeat protein